MHASIEGFDLPEASLIAGVAAGVCSSHREGQRVWYELIDPAVRKLAMDALQVSVERGRQAVVPR